LLFPYKLDKDWRRRERERKKERKREGEIEGMVDRNVYKRKVHA
jgi:hypothetical protein